MIVCTHHLIWNNLLETMVFNLYLFVISITWYYCQVSTSSPFYRGPQQNIWWHGTREPHYSHLRTFIIRHFGNILFLQVSYFSIVASCYYWLQFSRKVFLDSIPLLLHTSVGIGPKILWLFLTQNLVGVSHLDAYILNFCWTHTNVFITIPNIPPTQLPSR